MVVTVALGGILSIVGSGGGGGGGDGAAGPSPVIYAGVTTQATITQSNAQILVAAALQGGDTGSAVVSARSVASDDADSAGAPRFFVPALTLKASLGRAHFASASARGAAALQAHSETIPSPYGNGSLTLSFTYDDVTGVFDGTATYSNYCESAASCVSGDSGFSGKLNLAILDLEWAQFSFTLLNITENGNLYQISGSIGLNVLSPSSIQVTESFVIGYNTVTFKLDNYVYLFTDYFTYVEVSVPAGRFYHPTYGYVDVTTPTALRHNYLYGIVVEWPYQGALEIDGANNTRALLTAFSDGSNTMLLPRLGGEAVYDSVRSITWLSDANLAASNSFGVAGIVAGGSMSWATAQSWITAMNTANYLGFNDWRLPVTLQPDLTCSEQLPGIGSEGFYCTGSEMGHLFYQGLYGVAGQPVPPSGFFKNIPPGPYMPYWSGTETASSPFSAWDFDFGSGNQSNSDKASTFYAWPLRTGDVGASLQWQLEVDWDGITGWDTTLSGDWVDL